jgi:hypothetical protein
MSPHETLIDALRLQAVWDVTNRWEGRPGHRRRIGCLDHDAARCALEYLKTLRAVRLAAEVYDWDAREITRALFAVVRR